MSFKEITPEQAWEMMQNGAMLADVRDPQRFTYSQACSGLISLNDMVCSFCTLFIHAIKNNQAHRQY